MSVTISVTASMYAVSAVPSRAPVFAELMA